MDTVALVENQIEEGQRLLDRLEDEGVVVLAACWVKPVDDDRWSLYIATPAVDEKGLLDAYSQVLQVVRSLDDDWISSSDIKLVGAKHPLVQDVLDLLRRYPHRAPTPSPVPVVGRIPVDEIFVYTPGKKEVTVYGMVFRGEPGGALHLSLEPHNPHSKLMVESGGKTNEYPAETGIDWVVAAPVGATLRRDDIGRMVLAWDLYGHRKKSSANEVWSFANLGMHGFRFLHKPA